MSLHEALKKKLPVEIMGQVEDALGDDFDWDYIPRSRLNTVIRQRNELRAQLSDPDAATSKSGKDDEDGGEDVETKKSAQSTGAGKVLTQADIDAALAAKEAENQKAISDIKIQYAALEKLREAKAVDPELAFSLVKRESLKFTESGTLEGLDEQVKALTESKPFLFEASSAGVARGTGKSDGGTSKDGTSAVDSQLNALFAQFGPPAEQ